MKPVTLFRVLVRHISSAEHFCLNLQTSPVGYTIDTPHYRHPRTFVPWDTILSESVQILEYVPTKLEKEVE